MGELGLTVIFAALLAVIAWFISARLTSKRMRVLIDAATKMKAGDLSIRTRTQSRDEVGQLGRALDQLAVTLSKSIEELRDERDLLSRILDGMSEGVLLLDGAGRILLVNPALREMLLLSARVVGEPLLDVVRHAELKELLDRARARKLSDDEDEPDTKGEIELLGLKPRRLLVHATPLEEDGLLAVFVDTTEVRRLESLRRDFVANVSHELRTPVTAIRSAAETLRHAAAKNPEAAARFLDIIERNGERLQTLIEDILDLSRIESRELHLTPEAIELEPFFQHVVSLFRERTDKKKIRVIVDVADEMPRAYADRRALEQVVTNLIDNAVKYCGEGASVTVRAREKDASSVRIEVADTGPGIEASHLPRLFERFYRVDAGRSREVGGTGLGLSIVKHLVEAMRGTTHVESTVGVGATFSFRLPRA